MTTPIASPPPLITRNSEWIRRIGAVVAAILLYYPIQALTLVLAIYPHLGLRADLLAPGSFVRAFDHHFWQLVLALVAIAVIAGRRWRDWGLNLCNRQESMRLFWRFVYYYGVYFIGIGFLLQLFFLGPPKLDHPWTATHIAGRLAFGFLFVGVSEEILFRGLIHTWLARYWTKVWKWGQWEMPVAGFIAALIFTLAHINFSFVRLEVVQVSVPQLAQAFVLGLYYSAVYHRTGSLLNPVLAHNFSDGSLWASEYLLIGLRGSG